ncbi:hypothetical protein AVEN_202773-1 [Araneus ventricosus]|uniref:Uncharacterized protein n=1 Tax=Araneus ventricosus TaxID=182803 RepID=A0A4Y2VH81_ARAVE|nr:hypothetical protein AVEN_202773-1 [Araneus ventricosus]
MIKQAKIDCFEEFLDRIVQRNSQGVVKQTIKDKKLEVRILQIETEDGSYTQKFVESTDYVLKKHFPCLDGEDNITQRYVTDEATVDFSSDEIEACLVTMKKKGAPGWDGWTLEIITEIFDAGKE